MRTSLVAPGGDPPSIGNGIVCSEGLVVNDGQLLGQIAHSEQEPPPSTGGWKLASSHEPTEMVLVVARALGGALQGDELVVLGPRDSLEISEHLVAKLRSVYMSAEPGEFVAAHAPPRDETLACHVAPSSLDAVAIPE
jgi:hypothetical protein